MRVIRIKPFSSAGRASKPITTPQRSSKSTWQLIRSDLARYRVTDKRSYLTVLFLCPGAVSGIIYRVGHAIWTYEGPLGPLVKLLRPFYMVVKRMNEMLNGISIEPRAVIGEGLYVNHGPSIRIAGKCVLGANCNISHEVTLGPAIRERQRGAPVLGDRVFVGPGAKLFGGITIGDDVAIGANAVVTKSLPDRAVAVGIPAKVASRQGSFEFVLYDSIDQDEARQRSFALRGQETDGSG